MILDNLWGYDAYGNEINGGAGNDVPGVTAVQVTQNGQPTAITGYVQSQTGNSVTISLDLTGAGVTSGNYDIQLSVFGTTTPVTPADTFTVADTTPYISSVVPLSPLYPNGQASVEIFGSNFGPACPGNVQCPGAGISICQDSSPDPCVPTGTNVDVGSQITYWSNSQVNALLSVGSGATGYYDIVLVSAGSAGPLGTGFVAPSGTLGGGNVSNRARTAVNPPNLNLQVQVNVNGTNQPLSAGQCAYITAVPNPQMPQITATVVNQSNVPVSSGTATWTLNSTFLYTTNDSSGVHQATEQNSAPLNSTQTTATWTPGSFSSVFGGNAEIDWTYTAPGGSAQAGNPFHFSICGQNPDPTTATTALNVPSPMNQQYWFAPNIAIHETNLSQFCSASVGASYCVNNPQAVTLGLPVFGTPAGYGVMQLDPVPAPPPIGTSDALWNWQHNVTGGLAHLDALAFAPGTGTAHLGAYLFWQNQVAQWLFQDTKAPADAPSEVFPAPASCTFVAPVSPFTRQGQAVQAVPGNPPNTYWFGDAELMKQNAGATLNYIYWDNVSTPNVHEATFTWQWHRVSLPGHNAPYEFCTCGTNTSNCQHTTPLTLLTPP